MLDLAATPTEIPGSTTTVVTYYVSTQRQRRKPSCRIPRVTRGQHSILLPIECRKGVANKVCIYECDFLHVSGFTQFWVPGVQTPRRTQRQLSLNLFAALFVSLKGQWFPLHV